MPAGGGVTGAAAGDGSTLEGYAARFGVETFIPDQAGGFVEVIRRGAFARSLRESTPVLMFEHGRHPLVGTLPLGTLQIAEEDDKGLWVSARLLDTWLVEPVRAAVAAGAVNGMSFRFHVPEGGDRWSRRNGVDYRELLDVGVSELGPVVFPAYDATSVGVRSPRDDTGELVRRGIIPGRVSYEQAARLSYEEIVAGRDRRR